MSYTVSRIQNPPQGRSTYTAASGGDSRQTRDTHRVEQEQIQNQPRGTYVAPSRRSPSLIRHGTYTAASGQDSSYERGTPDEPPSFLFDSYYLHSDSENEGEASERSSASSGPPSLTAGRLDPAPSNAEFFYENAFPDYEDLPGPDTEYEDEVFEPDQPARFRATRGPTDFMRNFHVQNVQKVHEYNVLWRGLVDLLEIHQPFVNAGEITCPLVLTEIVKQLFVTLKLEFKQFKIQSMMAKVAPSLNFSRVQARIKRTQQNVSELLNWLKEEVKKVELDNLALQDQHLQLDSYLSYLEKKKQLLHDAFSSYPYHEALLKEAQNEKLYSDELRNQLVVSLQELNETKELVSQTIEISKSSHFDIQEELCQMAEEFEINALYDGAIKSVLGQNEASEPMGEIDETLIDDWTAALSRAVQSHMDHFIDAMTSCGKIMAEVTEKDGILLVFKEETEQLEFEVSLFSDNSILKNENIARLSDIIERGRDPRIHENADLYAFRGPDESFGTRLLDQSRLFSTPVRYADETIPLDTTFQAQQAPGDVLRQQHQLSPIRRPRSSPGVGNSAMIDDAFGFLDQSSSREVSDQPLDLSMKHLQTSRLERPCGAESAMVDDAFAFLDQSTKETLEQPLDLSKRHLESTPMKISGVSESRPGVRDSAVIEDAFAFLDQSTSSGISRQPFQSTFIRSPGFAGPSQPLQVSSLRDDFLSDYSSFAADPPQSVFFPRSERAVPKTKRKSLIPKLDRSQMKKAAQMTQRSFKPRSNMTDRSIYAISEHSPASKTVDFPPKGRKIMQPSKRPPWISSTRIPGSKMKRSPPASRSSPAFDSSHVSRTASIKAQLPPKSLIPKAIPRTPYQLKSPRTPYRRFIDPRFRQLDTSDTSSPVRSMTAQFQINQATPQGDRTYYPTPAIYRRGNVPIPPYVSSMHSTRSPMNRTVEMSPPMNKTVAAAPQMNRRLRVSPQARGTTSPINRTVEFPPQMNKTFEAAPRMNRTHRVAPETNRTFRGSPPLNKTFQAAP